MKILLVNPCYVHPLRRYAGGAIRVTPAPPLGLAYVAATLEEAGFETRILDMVALDMRPDGAVAAAMDFRPDAIGIGCNMAFVAMMATTVATSLREALPGIPIILGGSHATFTGAEILRQHPEIDYVVKREGERTFVEILRRIEAHKPVREVPGLFYRDDAGDIVETPDAPVIGDLDSLPPPARHLLPMRAYPSGDEGTRGILITSRGCPYRCAYCSTSSFHGRKVRRHGTTRVVDEIQQLVGDHASSFVAFADDTFTIDRRRTLELCAEIRRRDLRVSWGCDTRVDLVDPELLEAMRDAGCRVVFFGIESVTQETLDLIKKGFTLDRARSAIKQVRDAGIEAHASFIIGLPGETYDSTMRIASFVEETGVERVLYNVLIAYPGCPLFDDPSSYGITAFSTDWSRCEQTRPMVRTERMSDDDVRRAYVELLIHLRELELRGGGHASGTYQ